MVDTIQWHLALPMNREEIYTTRYGSITWFSSPFRPGVFGIILSDLGW